MSAYQLSRQEAWVLTTLLKLPIQQGSALGEWLGDQEPPSISEIETWIPLAIETLEHKEYTPARNGKEKGFSVDLIESLMLAAVGQKHIFVTLRTNGEGVSTRFLMAGSGVVQYGVEKDQIILHPSRQFEEALQLFLPDWLPIKPGDGASLTMPQPAFLLFKQAGLQRDIAYVLNANGSETFSEIALEEGFARDNGWVDVFHALGIQGITTLEKISVPAQIDYLLSIGYLEKKDPTNLQIGPAGAALAESLSDPDRVIVTLGFTSLQPEKWITSVFLIGKSHLYRLDFLGELICITPMRSRLEGLAWIRALV